MEFAAQVYSEGRLGAKTETRIIGPLVSWEQFSAAAASVSTLPSQRELDFYARGGRSSGEPIT